MDTRATPVVQLPWRRCHRSRGGVARRHTRRGDQTPRTLRRHTPPPQHRRMRRVPPRSPATSCAPMAINGHALPPLGRCIDAHAWAAARGGPPVARPHGRHWRWRRWPPRGKPPPTGRRAPPLSPRRATESTVGGATPADATTKPKEKKGDGAPSGTQTWRVPPPRRPRSRLRPARSGAPRRALPTGPPRRRRATAAAAPRARRHPGWGTLGAGRGGGGVLAPGRRCLTVPVGAQPNRGVAAAADAATATGPLRSGRPPASRRPSPRRRARAAVARPVAPLPPPLGRHAPCAVGQPR